jgi:hypothetical protein
MPERTASKGHRFMLGASASTLLWWANEIRIWAAALAAVAAVASWVASYYQIRLSSVVSAEKDRAFQQYRAAAEERTAQAQADAEAAKERAAALERDTAQLNLAIEKERLLRTRLQNQVAWRRLTSEQKQALVEALRGQSFKVWVTTVRDDPEARLFHQEIFEALKSAGLDVQWFTGYAMAVGLTTNDSTGPEHELLRRAFEAAGLSLSPSGGDGMKDGAPEITVGSKPPPF